MTNMKESKVLTKLEIAKNIASIFGKNEEPKQETLVERKFVDSGFEHVTYEEAELECIEKLIEIVKNK
jgi:hypothetical protein